MLDFSFLKDGDVIAIKNESELEAILTEFEKSGICWADGDKATLLDEGLKKKVRYLIFHGYYDIGFLPFFEDYGACFLTCKVVSIPDESTCIYTVSEVLSSATQQPEEIDEPEVSEIDIRQFLIS